MSGDIDFFKQFLYEAPGDDPPPDVAQDSGGDSSPPDLPEDSPSMDMSDPPDIPPDDGGDMPGPPDIGGDDSGYGDEFGSEDESGQEGDNATQNFKLDEKISAIMNHKLYQKCLTLLGTIKSKISEIKDNSDVLYAITPDCIDIMKRLTSLEENLKLYIKNKFVNEDYGKNLLFFNECQNLFALLNTIFENAIKKGIKHVDN